MCFYGVNCEGVKSSQCPGAPTQLLPRSPGKEGVVGESAGRSAGGGEEAVLWWEGKLACLGFV